MVRQLLPSADDRRYLSQPVGGDLPIPGWKKEVMEMLETVMELALVLEGSSRILLP